MSAANNPSSSSSPLNIQHLSRTIPITYSPPITTEQANRAISSSPFRTWLSNLATTTPESSASRIVLHSIHLQSIDFFGPTRVGFIKLCAKCTTPDGEHTLPGICFLRGSSVGVLVVIKTSDGDDDDDDGYCVLTEQARIPVGSVMLEIPAGMIDDESHTFSGTAARELEEECEIIVKEDELIDLTSTFEKGICMSPGGCDEYIKLFYCEKKMTKVEVEQLQGKLTGLKDHGEVITLRIVKMKDVGQLCCDAKTLCALYLLSKRKSEA